MKSQSLSVLPKRHRVSRRKDDVVDITKPALRRLARRGGIKRVSGSLYKESRDQIKTFLEQLIKDGLIYMGYRKRSTLSRDDIKEALRRQGRTFYV